MLVHVDTERAHDQLVNSRLAYASVSRRRYDAQIYTNDAGELGEELSRDVSKNSALATGHEMGERDHGHATENAGLQSVSERSSAELGEVQLYSAALDSRFINLVTSICALAEYMVEKPRSTQTAPTPRYPARRCDTNKTP